MEIILPVYPFDKYRHFTMHAQQRHKTLLQFCLATHTEILQHVDEHFMVPKWQKCLTDEECLD